MRRVIGLIVGLTVAGAVPPPAAQMGGTPVYVPIGMGTGVNIAG